MLQVSPSWLLCYCDAAWYVMEGMSSQQLTMTLWGLACAGAAPDKALMPLWFLSSKQQMHQATTQVRLVQVQ